MNINNIIRKNMVDSFDWNAQELGQELYWWVDAFNFLYFKDQAVPVPAISFERTAVTRLGHYVIGRNAMGIKENINFNSAWLGRPLALTLCTLLHEMCHSWQHNYGKPSTSWIHNKEFIEKMQGFGIEINKKGQTVGIGGSYVYYMWYLKVEFKLKEREPGSGVFEAPKVKAKGKSKLKKWSCGCQNVRVGTAQFSATCNICCNHFTEVK